MFAFGRYFGLFVISYVLVCTNANAQDHRHALVIGVQSYTSPVGPLKNPVAEARAVTTALQKLGFETNVVLDGTRTDIVKAVTRFAERLTDEGKSVAFLYYTGQGTALDNENLLIPVDMKEVTEEAVKESGIKLSDIVSQVSRSNPHGFNFFAFDSSRTDLNPKNTRGLVPATAPVVTSLDTVILYATQPGGVASDLGDLGPFATAFLKNIATPGQDFHRFLSKMQADVLELTKGSQRPTIVGLAPVLYLVPAGERPPDLQIDAEFFRQQKPGARKRATVTVDQLTEAQAKIGHVLLRMGNSSQPVYEGSYALLIGISEYDKETKAWKSLPGVKKDIVALKTILIERHGFEVTTVMDPDDAEMEAQFKDFIAVHGAKENARILIYYAGHGFTTTVSSGADTSSPRLGWLVPRNAPSPYDAPAKFRVTAMNMQRIVEYSSIIQAKHVLWVFDSCFSGAVFDISSTRGGQEQILPKHLRENIRQIITSGSADEEVPDKSEFAQLLVDALKGSVRVGREEDFFTGNELGEYLQQMVRRYRNETQNPQNGVVRIRGLDTGRFVFKVGP